MKFSNSELKVAKWPFLLADALLLGAAGMVLYRAPAPFVWWQIVACTGAVAMAGFFGVLPFIIEYRACSRMAETDILAQSMGQLQNIEALSRQVTSATAQWHEVQATATQTTETA